METARAILMLDDGAWFSGEACGARGEAAGEVVFTTGMAGYQETLTDPSFLGQIVTFTSAHLGNYGASCLDNESLAACGGATAHPLIRARGAVFHELFIPEPQTSPFPHWRAEESLDQRLAREGITGIRNVDTRSLTLHLREHGARGGIISALDLDKPSLLRRARELPPMQGQDLAREATCAAPHRAPCQKESEAGLEPLPVAVLDFGLKRSILACLESQGLEPLIWPAAAEAGDILAAKPAGLLLSNGPGDPEPCTYAIRTVRKLLGKLPVFGICLGHQILGLALGAKTYKLPFGHHGVNHPVKDLHTDRVWITSQNHGFNVAPDSLPGNVEPSHWNLNDQTLEGLRCKDLPAFSVQFHPEAGPGPLDAVELFGRFRKMLFDWGSAPNPAGEHYFPRTPSFPAGGV